MEGLEASIVSFVDLERTSRLDAEYFQKSFLKSAKLIERWERDSVASLCHVSDGNHFSISADFVEKGIPYYRGQDVTGRFFVETAFPIHITQEAYDRKFMRRSYLEKGDVLLSIIGTIGELSLVASDQPATCSCKLAILRPKDVDPEFLAAFLHCSHGRNQIERLTRGAVQKGLILEDLDQLWVPLLSEAFRSRITNTVQSAKNHRGNADLAQSEAETKLLDALGLSQWSPSDPLAYISSSSGASLAGRLDAEHFRPKYDEAFQIAEKSGVECTSLAQLVEPFRAGVDLRNFTEIGTPYIRVGDIKAGRIEIGTAKCVSTAQDEVKASIALQANDVLFTRKGSYGNAAIVKPGQEAAIISTEIILLRLLRCVEARILPEFLAAYFNSPLGKLQAEKWAHGVAFYSVTQDDLGKFQVPLVDIAVQREIATDLNRGEASMQVSRSTLLRAERAVEIAIEEGEPAAFSYLDHVGEVN